MCTLLGSMKDDVYGANKNVLILGPPDQSQMST